MDLHLYYMNADTIKTVAVARDGSIITVTPVTDKLSRDFQFSAESIAFSYMGVRNVKCAEFVRDYIYIEKLSEHEMYRVNFELTSDGKRHRPLVTSREQVDGEQVSILQMLDNLAHN